jgi:hypothetical protein
MSRPTAGGGSGSGCGARVMRAPDRKVEDQQPRLIQRQLRCDFSGWVQHGRRSPGHAFVALARHVR